MDGGGRPWSSFEERASRVRMTWRKMRNEPGEACSPAETIRKQCARSRDSETTVQREVGGKERLFGDQK